MANAPEGAEQRGHAVVNESRRDVQKVAEAINREVAAHSKDPAYKAEFLQAASSELQKQGLLPAMAASFGVQNFKLLDDASDTKSKDSLTSAEVDRGLAANKSKFTPTEQLAGQYLSTALKSGDVSYRQNAGSAEELSAYGQLDGIRYAQDANGKLAAKLFGQGTKGFELTDVNRDGHLSTDEINNKYSLNSALKEYTNLKPGKEDVLNLENHALRWLSQEDVRRTISPYNPQYLSGQGISKMSGWNDYSRFINRDFVVNAEKID